MSNGQTMQSSLSAPDPCFAISLGDPAGVGPEIVAKAWVMREARSLPCFFAVGDPASISAVWNGPLREIGSPEEVAGIFPEALPYLRVADAGPVTPGQPSVDGARAALEALEASVGLARSGS